MKNLLLFSLVSCILMFASACQNEPQTSEETATEKQEEPTTSSSEGGIAPLHTSEVQLICVPADDPNQEPGFPQSEVFLHLAESKVKVADILACETIEKNQYNSHQIPENAIVAVGGWWAGKGDYVYVVEENGNFVVKKGEIFEEQEDNSYNYQTVMTFDKKGEQAL